MNNRKWSIGKPDEALCKKIEQTTGFRPMMARLLANRMLDTPEKVTAFLDKEHLTFYDPFLLADMDKAVKRINLAIERKESVCIYGDYDVDGVTSTVLLYTYLRSKGLDCTYFIPERISEGYGLSLPVIEKMSGSVDLIITVDTGVTAVAEAEYASSVGVDMVITDHHSCRGVLPKVCAVVNPHREDCQYPFANLAGVGVVFKLLCALEGNTDRILERYADIIAVGTIADVMPIVDENRCIAALGLKKLSNTSNLGLRALMRHAGIIKPGHGIKKITSATVGYVLAPRINAAGRIASASRAVELLLTDNEAEADLIAAELCEINKLRQMTEQKIYEQAIGIIADFDETDRFFVLSYEGWHQGVIGVVASKLAEKYSRPCILFSQDGEVSKGSGRSIKGFSLMDALASCGDLLLEYGGHELAAGLSIETSKIDEFRRRINEYAAPLLAADDTSTPLEIECETAISELSEQGIDEMLLLEPFGLANPQPVLMLADCVIRDIVPLSQGKHLRFTLNDDSGSITAVWFGMQESVFPHCEGDRVDTVFTADINEYMGMRSPQLFIKAIRLSESENRAVEECSSDYERLLSGTYFDAKEDSVPNLGDFRTIFRFIKRECTADGKKISLTSACRNINAEFSSDITLCKLRVALEVLAEQGLISLSWYSNENDVTVTLLPFSGKINIDNSELLRTIRGK